MNSIQPLILAAGKGTRMGGVVKGLVPLHGVPLIEYVIRSLQACAFGTPIAIVVSPDSPIPHIAGPAHIYITQHEAKGTGHAVSCAHEALQGKATHILVVPVDQPRVSAASLTAIVQESTRTEAVITMSVVQVPHLSDQYSVFYDFGRVVRTPEGGVDAIVEMKDVSVAQREVRELNASMYCFEARWLWENITRLQSANAQGEYYLTDLIAVARAQGHTVASVVLSDPFEAIGINTSEQLKMAEELMRIKI